MKTSNRLATVLVLYMSVQANSFADQRLKEDIKGAGKDIGHTFKNVGKTIGHTTKKVVKQVGHDVHKATHKAAQKTKESADQSK